MSCVTMLSHRTQKRHKKWSRPAIFFRHRSYRKRLNIIARSSLMCCVCTLNHTDNTWKNCAEKCSQIYEWKCLFDWVYFDWSNLTKALPQIYNWMFDTRSSCECRRYMSIRLMCARFWILIDVIDIYTGKHYHECTLTSITLARWCEWGTEEK